MQSRWLPRTYRRIACLTLISLAAALAGCGSLGGGSETASVTGPGAAPVALAPRRDGPPPVAMAVDDAEMRKAIERHRITRNRRESPVEFAGADLNGDGRAEAIVLFTGEDWCSPTGCSLVVFSPGEFGYRTVSHTVSARGPIAVGPGGNAGWRDLLVRTGGGAAPMRIVRLQFTGGGYPVNALLQPQPTPDVIAQGEVLIQGGQSADAASAASSPR